MKISELSDRSGVAVASIKFYLREGLLPAGALSSPTQASYDESHVRRLRLVRALIDVGDLSVAATRTVLAAIDDTSLPIDWAFGIAQQAISTSITTTDAAAEPSVGAALLDTVLTQRGWRISDDNPGRAMAERVLDTYERLGLGHLVSTLPAYVRAAEIVAEADLAAVAQSTERADMVETVVVGTVLGDALFAGVRRVAQERASDIAFPSPEGEC